MDLSNELPDVKPADLHPDWASLLPPQVFASVILVLRAALPPPVVDEPGEWLARDQVAMAAVASLAPASAAETRLAAPAAAWGAGYPLLPASSHSGRR